MSAPLSPIVVNPASLINRDLIWSTGAFMGIPNRANRFGGRRNARLDSMKRVCRLAVAVMIKLTVLFCPCRRLGER